MNILKIQFNEAITTNNLRYMQVKHEKVFIKLIVHPFKAL